MEDTLTSNLIDGIQFAQKDLNYPVFTWNGANYGCTPSTNRFERVLESGGFVVDELLNMTVLLVDNDGVFTFPGNVTPQPQQIIQYNGNNYRIISTFFHPTGAYCRLNCQCITRGI